MTHLFLGKDPAYQQYEKAAQLKAQQEEIPTDEVRGLLRVRANDTWKYIRSHIEQQTQLGLQLYQAMRNRYNNTPELTPQEIADTPDITDTFLK